MKYVLIVVLVLGALGAGVYFAFVHNWSPSATTEQQPSKLGADGMLPNAKALLFAKRKDTLIGTIDVQADAATLQTLSIAERKEVLLRTALHLATVQMRENAKLAGADKIKLYVIQITNANEYAQGDFRGMIELGTIESTPDLAANTAALISERTTSVTWKPGVEK